MGANIYGVSNPGPKSFAFGMGGDVVCNPGVVTPFIVAGNLYAPSRGYFYPMIWCLVSIVTGATNPTGIQMGFNVNGGSAVDLINFDMSPIPQAGYSNLSFPLVGVASNVSWIPPGSTINVYCNTTGQAITVRAFDTRAVIALLRAPDQ